jgi:hypothetical protein
LDVSDNPLFEHHDLQGRILARLRSADIKGQLLKNLMYGFDAAMAGEVMILSRKDRNKLFFYTVSIILEDILGDLEART